jgi:serine protease Do
LISEVVAGGPAANAGVKVNDILVGINGFQIHSADEMSSYLEEKTLPGQSVTLSIIRNNSPLNLTLVLGTRPAPP